MGMTFSDRTVQAIWQPQPARPLLPADLLPPGTDPKMAGPELLSSLLRMAPPYPDKRLYSTDPKAWSQDLPDFPIGGIPVRHIIGFIAAASLVAASGVISSGLAELVHDIGHKQLSESLLGSPYEGVHQWMDRAAGRFHRDVGHTIWDVIHAGRLYGGGFQLGPAAAALLHLIQDFLTADGVRLVGGATIAQVAAALGVKEAVVRSLVSISLQEVLIGIGMAWALWELWQITKHLATARALREAREDIERGNYEQAYRRVEPGALDEENLQVFLVRGQALLMWALAKRSPERAVRACEQFENASKCAEGIFTIRIPHAAGDLKVAMPWTALVREYMAAACRTLELLGKRPPRDPEAELGYAARDYFRVDDETLLGVAPQSKIYCSLRAAAILASLGRWGEAEGRARVALAVCSPAADDGNEWAMAEMDHVRALHDLLAATGYLHRLERECTADNAVRAVEAIYEAASTLSWAPWHDPSALGSWHAAIEELLQRAHAAAWKVRDQIGPDAAEDILAAATELLEPDLTAPEDIGEQLRPYAPKLSAFLSHARQLPHSVDATRLLLDSADYKHMLGLPLHAALDLLAAAPAFSEPARSELIGRAAQWAAEARFGSSWPCSPPAKAAFSRLRDALAALPDSDRYVLEASEGTLEAAGKLAKTQPQPASYSGEAVLAPGNILACSLAAHAAAVGQLTGSRRASSLARKAASLIHTAIT